MDRNDFHQLLKKYVEGTCTEEEHALIQQWYLLLDDEPKPLAGPHEMQELETRMWDTIKENIGLRADKSFELTNAENTHYPWRKWAAVAAVFTGVMVSIFMVTVKTQSAAATLIAAKVSEGLSEEINNSGAAKKVTLEDGSIVTLQPKAAIAFPRHFLKNKREVYLDGEAFFEVSKNAARPFFVYNDRLITQVLGTSFNVKIVNDKIIVSVKTGRVAVYENGEEVLLNEQQKKNNGVIITPNQKVIYYNENRHFITSLVDAPAIVPVENNLPAAPNKFVFDDTPLTDVLDLLQKNYGLEIVLANKDLANCPFTGDLSKQPLFNTLNIVCQAFQATYEVKGTIILINGGRGCH